jgi:hypothetical protein
LWPGEASRFALWPGEASRFAYESGLSFSAARTLP